MQRVLDLRSATEVLVIAGTGYDPRRRRDNHVQHRERGVGVIAHLAGLLTDLGNESHAWMEWPNVSLVFLNGELVLAEYGVLGEGDWIRTPSDGDRQVLQSEEFGAWLRLVGALAVGLHSKPTHE